MSKPNIEYSDYESIIDILKNSTQDDVYQDLMGKEDKTLDTINNVIKYYKDVDYKKKQFINMSFSEIVIRFSEIYFEIFTDLSEKKLSILSILMKNDRPMYIGILLIIISFLMFFIIISD
jgi:SNF2 family DNA or RNA helicase